MPENPLERIREFLYAGNVKNALEQLDSWVLNNNRSEHRNGISLWLADLNRTETEFSQGLVTDTDRRVVHQRITKGVLALLDQLGAGRPAMHAYHCYTCDRVDQSDTFSELFEKNKASRKQFYFLYGWERQSHLGMFRRIAYEQEGAFLDDLSPRTEPGCRARKLELRLRPTRKEQLFKIDIIKNLFHLLEVPPEPHEPLLEKNLSYLAAQTPLFQELSSKDFLCIYIPILSYDWDSEVTPKVAKWMFEEFCKEPLPETSPTFLFFFAVVFEEEDADLVQEIRQTVETSQHIFPLPELDKVNKRDIRRWFSVYHQLTPSSETRDQLLATHFGPGQDPVDMEIVELNLRKIIDQFNNTYIQ